MQPLLRQESKPVHLDKSITERQALILHKCIAALMRELRLEPGLLAGSSYAELHANDIELFQLLAEPGVWNVRAVADAIGAPMTTVSSALDRLEDRGLLRRVRTATDRRMVCIELAPRGKRLALRLREAHVANCRTMLLRLDPNDREVFLRLTRQIAKQ
jgi:DNA-binding MarR family transcriptional regulator